MSAASGPWSAGWGLLGRDVPRGVWRVEGESFVFGQEMLARQQAVGLAWSMGDPASVMSTFLLARRGATGCE